MKKITSQLAAGCSVNYNKDLLCNKDKQHESLLFSKVRKFLLESIKEISNNTFISVTAKSERFIVNCCKLQGESSFGRLLHKPTNSIKWYVSLPPI